MSTTTNVAEYTLTETRDNKIWSSPFNYGGLLSYLNDATKITKDGDKTLTFETANGIFIEKFKFQEGEADSFKIPPRQVGGFQMMEKLAQKVTNSIHNQGCEITVDITFEPGVVVITYNYNNQTDASDTNGPVTCDANTAKSVTDQEFTNFSDWRGLETAKLQDAPLGCLKSAQKGEASCIFGYKVSAGVKDQKETLKFFGELAEGELPTVKPVGQHKADQKDMTPKLMAGNTTATVTDTKAEGVSITFTNNDADNDVIVYFNAVYKLDASTVSEDSWSLNDDKYLTPSISLLDSSKAAVYFSNTGGIINGGMGWLIWIIVGGVVVLAAVAILAYNRWGRAPVDENEEEE